MDADVAELVLADRLRDAAALSAARGDVRTASLLFERACDWRSAASQSLRAGDGPRALDLALRAGDTELAREAVTLVAAEPASAERAAAQLAAQGRPGWAARVLDLALRRDGGDVAAALALGALLVRFGKDEAGLKALQRVSSRAPERREALRLMLAPLRRLGLAAAARDAAIELAALAQAPGAKPAPPAVEIVEVTPAAWLHGRYDVVRQVASSVSARVLEAIDRALGERVALKVYATGERGSAARAAFDRLDRELRALRAIEAPSVVPVRDVDGAESLVALAWMDGGTLEQVLATGSAVAPARAVEIACAVLSALGEAHRIGIVHRGVKPTNVLFDAAGAAHLSDFGAAHVADASATVTAGAFSGLAYQSPEQREGRPVTARSDVFAVGVLLAEMLAGRRRSAAAESPPPSEVHAGLDARHDRVVAALLAPLADARPADAFQARDRLHALSWPGDASGAGTSSDERGVGERPGEGRLSVRAEGGFVDAWTGRVVECVPLSDDVIARARLFAAADHGALQPVLRIDQEGGRLWLAGCGAPLDRPLTDAERARIRSALDALVVAGADPSGLDAGAVALDGQGAVVFRF